MNFNYRGFYDVRGLAYQLSAQPALWNERPLRLYENGPFNETDDIWVRWRPENELTSAQAYLEPHFATWYPAWHKLPALQPIVYDLMARLRATHLGGVLITRIPAGKEAKPHDDRGSWHAEFYTTKVYVVIENNPHCINRCGNDELVMGVGEAWEFDNLITHSVSNNGQSDRVSAIICMKVEP